ARNDPGGAPPRVRAHARALSALCAPRGADLQRALVRGPPGTQRASGVSRRDPAPARSRQAGEAPDAMNERSTLAQSATSQEERLQALVRASRELALLKRDELARRARDLLLRSSTFSEFSLWVLDPRTEVLYPWTLCNTPVMGRRPRLAVGQGVAGAASAEESPAFHPSLAESQYVAEEGGGRPRSLIHGGLAPRLGRE